tara:strand:- start:154 stop:381 length:228 start_codon:yes stop_codon:yes gene_type:complete
MELIIKILKGLANQGIFIAFFVVFGLNYCRLLFNYLKSNELDKARNALKGIIVNFILILIFYINQLIFFKGGPLA